MKKDEISRSSALNVKHVTFLHMTFGTWKAINSLAVSARLGMEWNLFRIFP